MDRIFHAVLQARCDALVVFPTQECSRSAALFASQARLPSVSGWRLFARNGLLLTYGPNVSEIYRRWHATWTASCVAQNPPTFPVELPTRFEFVINLKAAKAVGLTVPPTLFAQADEVIE